MRLLVAVTLADFPPRDPSRKKELNQMFWNRLFDLPGRKVAGPRDEPASKFIGPLIWGYFEIQNTYFTICNVHQFFNRTPRGLANLRAKYLAFVIHGYLDEIYVLDERMCGYLKVLTRAAAKGSEVRETLEKIGPELTKAVHDAFKVVRGTRGAHVHQQRFCDDRIDRLGTFELMNHLPQHFPQLDAFYRSELSRVRKSWNERFEANEIAIKVLFDRYYDLILRAIFKTDGSLRVFL